MKNPPQLRNIKLNWIAEYIPVWGRNANGKFYKSGKLSNTY